MRGPITEHVLMYARGKMPGGFADIAGITARTRKLVYHTRMELTRDRVFHTNLNMLPRAYMCTCQR